MTLSAVFACIDVAYAETVGTAAIAAFDAWNADAPVETATRRVEGVGEYRPGAFFERELPCLLEALRALRHEPRYVVVDGHAWLATHRPGLGAHLYQALGQRARVIGVAKNPFHGNDAAIEVHRGQSRRPLYVSACGLTAADAAARVRRMHGPHRLPTPLSLVDALCRAAD